MPAAAIRFDVLTLFPDLFQGYAAQSLLKLAVDAGLVQIHLWNIRDWAADKHQKVDDRPFGGGPGMVLMAEPFAAAAAQALAGHAPGARLLLLATFRDAEADMPDALAETLADLRRSDDVVPARMISAPKARAPSILIVGAVVGMTTTAGAPSVCAARAIAWP